MRFYNDSSVPDAYLLPVLKFVSAYAPSHERVFIHVRNSQDFTNMGTGWAGKEMDGVLVGLRIRPPEHFFGPFLTREVDTVEYIEVRSWEEELVVLAAHELRHAEQFLNQPRLDANTAEEDAERFASLVLEAFRGFRQTLT